MANTDKDLQIATQIAYMDFDKSLIDNNKGATVRELLEQKPNYLSDLQNELANAQDAVTREQLQGKIDVYNEIMEEGSKYGDWIIKDIKDDNANSGFYACMIETGEREAIIGFRGSEGSSEDKSQYVKDWGKADFGLLNSPETRQQAVAEEYMKELNEKYGNEYDSYDLTGHSLGGNLSFHAALTAPPEMQDKIRKAYSFDGPGYSDEYLIEHREQIEKMSSKMTHLGWSPIGFMLNMIPGANNIEVEVDEIGDKDASKYYFFRHDTCFIHFNEDGSVKEGKCSPEIKALGQMSVMIDEITTAEGLWGAVELVCIIVCAPQIIGTYVFEYVAQEITKVVSWIQSTFLGRRTKADFDIRLRCLQEAVAEEQNIKTQMGGIISDIYTVRRQLSGSISMWYCKTKLSRIENYVESEQKGMEKMAKASSGVVSQYQLTEQRIRENATAVCGR